MVDRAATPTTVESVLAAANSGDRLVLASDGLSGFISHEDLRQGATQYPNPQQWADYLVQLALERGSRDNVTCVVLAFDPA